MFRNKNYIKLGIIYFNFGDISGHLDVEIVPCLKTGQDIGDDFVDDPPELVRRYS